MSGTVHVHVQLYVHVYIILGLICSDVWYILIYWNIDIFVLCHDTIMLIRAPAIHTCTCIIQTLI